LIGGIGQEVPFEDGLGACQVGQSHQLFFRQQDATELLLERFALRFDVQNSMIFRSLLLRGEGRQFDGGTEFFQI